jgi:hypothetical protein
MVRGIDRQQAGSYEEQPFARARLRTMARGIDRQQGWPLQQNRSS